MQFILFLDEVGAEFTQARTTRKDIVALERGKLLRFRPYAIRPIEIIEEKGAARRAAGGFVLLGPLGAALGVLTGKGQQVLFEMDDGEGTTRRGIVAQEDYSSLRRYVEAMQSYQSGDLGKSIAVFSGFMLLLAIFVAATGPIGFIIAPAMWFGTDALFRRLRRKGEPA